MQLYEMGVVSTLLIIHFNLYIFIFKYFPPLFVFDVLGFT